MQASKEAGIGSKGDDGTLTLFVVHLGPAYPVHACCLCSAVDMLEEEVEAEADERPATTRAGKRKRGGDR